MNVCLGPRELAALTARGPVLNRLLRAKLFGKDRPAGVAYSGPPTTAHPLLPLMPWGIAYDLDLVLIGAHERWDMLELAKVRLPTGEMWLAKEARRANGGDPGGPPGEQLIVGDASDEVMDRWLPEVPVRRKSGLSVTTAGRDLSFAWTNHDGQDVTAGARIPGWLPPAFKRNGPTFQHSQDSMLAVLDLATSGLFRRGRWAVDGVAVPMKKALCLAPLTVGLGQTQGGLATGHWTHEGSARRVTVTTGRGPIEFVPERAGGLEAWRSVDPGGAMAFREIEATYIRGRDTLELLELRVGQCHRLTPVTRIRFSPALPDFRRPLAQPAASHFVVDINGRRSHAWGTVEVKPTEAGATLEVRGTAPSWVEARPMRAALERSTGAVECAMIGA